MTAEIECLLGNFQHKSVGQGHEFVDDHKGNTEAGTECDNLLTDHVTKSNGPIGVFVQNFCHSSVGDDVPSAFDDLMVEIADEVAWNIWDKKRRVLACS